MPYRGQASAAVLQFWLDTPVSPNPEETGYAHLIRGLLGHTKLESTIRYLGIEVDDALEIAEHTDV